MIEDALRSFVELMESGDLSVLVPLALVVVAFGYLLVLLHELGHATVALACTESLVLVRVGRYPGALRGRIGRLSLSLDVRREAGGRHEGIALVAADLTPGERLAYSLAGPAANIAVALLLVPTFVAVSGGWRWVVGLAIGVSTLVALRNLVSRDPASDGRQALAALRDRGRHTPNDFADAVGRWMALYGRPGDARFSTQRMRLFGAVLVEVGLAPGSRDSQALAYREAARAGWCWREARHLPEPVLAPARDAWKEESLEGRAGLELAAAAAAVVVRRGGPAGTDDGFVVFSELGGLRDDDGRRRLAFRYGAALHDVERVLAAAGERYW